MKNQDNETRGDLPRVTHILQEVGIIDTRWYTKKSAGRGSDIHLLTEMIDDGLLLYTDIIGNEFEGWLTGYFKFKAENEVIIKETEKLVIYKGEYPYQGHVDRIATINGEDYIIDIKTGAIVEWNGLQLAAYGMAYNPDMKRAILKLDKNGNYRFKTKYKKDFDNRAWIEDWIWHLKKYYQLHGGTK